MRRLPGSKSFLFALLACSAVSSAAAADHKLLTLVPPGAQDVTGISVTSRQPDAGYFVLLPHKNYLDADDFLALSGADSTRTISDLIYVATFDSTGALNGHSVLVCGNFDRERIYKSAVEGGANVIRYHNLSVLVVEPFARERGVFNEVRWLAFPESDIVLFGSITAVQQELDRYLAHSAPDPRLLATLSGLRHDDQIWTLLSPPAWDQQIRSALAVINPQLAADLRDGDALRFGIRFGQQVEFEYAVTRATEAASSEVSDSLMQPIARQGNGLSLLPSPDNNVHGIIKFSMARYNALLAQIYTHGQGRKE
jgi:hypothetical protein